MSRYVVWTVLLAAVLASIGWWLRPTAAPAPGGVETATAPARAPAVARSDAPAAAAADSGQPQAGPAEQALPPGLDAEEARRRRQLLALRRAADERFSETVAVDGLRSDDVDPAVRRLFGSLTLTPEFDLGRTVEGQVSGLRIAQLSGANPLAAAGFRSGDVLTRLDGQPLNDPAQIAYTIMDLDSEFEVCAKRRRGEYCRLVTATADRK